ncbi:MAG: aldose 1-epimerase [Solirubrobacterales bacterium]|nr:aldose 1-epimerase [Solirubrobacterales bacterium]
MIGEQTIDRYRAVTLADRMGKIEVAFVPEAGMVGCSLRHRGEELLGQRGGLRNYVDQRSTMGIPLLYPWANRLSERRFRCADRTVDLDLASPPPSVDPNGKPIHGLLAAADGWLIEHREPADDGGSISARFEFGAERQLIEAFPFPHTIWIEADLRGPELTVTTTVEPTGEAAVPVAFGFHPYFRLPGIERSAWRIEIPVTERLELDRDMIPTGDRRPVAVESGPLGSRTFDDAYTAPPDSAPLVLEGGGRRIEVRLGPGYPYTQVYAPADDDVVALEPMTAPTNALVRGGPELTLVPPGQSYTAGFSVRVLDAEGRVT